MIGSAKRCAYQAGILCFVGASVLASPAELSAATIVLKSSVSQTKAGAPVTFTTAVAGAGLAGTVSFLDGANSLSGCVTSPLVKRGKKISHLYYGLMPVGSHTIVARYNGDASNGVSTSNAISQVVVKTPTILTLHDLTPTPQAT